MDLIIMMTLERVSHTDSKNIWTMFVCSGFTELWLTTNKKSSDIKIFLSLHPQLFNRCAVHMFKYVNKNIHQSQVCNVISGSVLSHFNPNKNKKPSQQLPCCKTNWSLWCHEATISGAAPLTMNARPTLWQWDSTHRSSFQGREYIYSPAALSSTVK